MDVFKLAFETTIVGLLTFGWLGVATHLLFPDFQFDSIRQKFPDFAKNNPTAIGVGLLILAYCLGSAILPIANQLVNDEHWPLPENAIRCLVFKQQQKRFGEIRKEFFCRIDWKRWNRYTAPPGARPSTRIILEYWGFCGSWLASLKL
jgi:hypothetical protein